jgi:NAD(P)-dependent dehydrogenase (short-subunit alcohol dehydrogenase family)
VNHGSVLVAPPAEFAHTVAVNLTGAYRTAAAVVPHLVRSRGYLLFVASVAAFAPLTGAAAYAASKAGVDSLAGTLRLELAAHGVAVGCAYPGWIDTDMVRASEALLPSLRGARASLPWPLRSVAPVQTCAVALADAVERRARRVYVPRAAVLARVLGPVLASATTQRALRGRIRALLTQLDEEAASAAPAGVTR